MGEPAHGPLARVKPIHIIQSDLNPMGLQNEAGWVGAFTRAQAMGAIPNGMTIRKREGDPGDTQPIGTLGRVLGSFASPPGATPEMVEKTGRDVRYFYFVEWMPLPRHAVGMVDWKIEPAPRG